jgi:hypothetical protein
VDPSQVLGELLDLCKKLGFPIRQEAMHVPATRMAGGMVRLHGRPLIIVDDTAPIVDRVGALADVLAGLELPTVPLSVDTKAALTRARMRRRRAKRRAAMGRCVQGPWKRSRLLSPKPGLHRCDEGSD